MIQRTQASIRAAILSRVKAGETIERAAAAEAYSNSAVWHWAGLDPAFRAALVHARRVGSPTTRRKSVFLAAIADGRTVRQDHQGGQGDMTLSAWARERGGGYGSRCDRRVNC